MFYKADQNRCVTQKEDDPKMRKLEDLIRGWKPAGVNSVIAGQHIIIFPRVVRVLRLDYAPFSR